MLPRLECAPGVATMSQDRPTSANSVSCTDGDSIGPAAQSSMRNRGANRVHLCTVMMASWTLQVLRCECRGVVVFVERFVKREIENLVHSRSDAQCHGAICMHTGTRIAGHRQGVRKPRL